MRTSPGEEKEPQQKEEEIERAQGVEEEFGCAEDLWAPPTHLST